MVIEDFGSMVIEINSEKVPKTAENFLELCEKKYYNGLIFHRLIKDFMVSFWKIIIYRYKEETLMAQAKEVNPTLARSLKMSFILS